MKQFRLTSLLLAACLTGCLGQNLKPPTGNANITPQSGLWTVNVDGHPELSGAYEFDFITDQGPAKLSVKTAAGRQASAPLKWTGGNFDIYLNYSIDNGYYASDELSIAIISTTQMTGVYTYNSGGAVPVLGSGTLGGATNSEPSYQANFTATYGAPSPSPSASTAPAASGAASPSPAASASPTATPSASAS